MAHVILKGSERTAVLGATAQSAISPQERFEVTVLVRRQARAQFDARVAALCQARSTPAHMTREDFAQRHGADPADFNAIRSFAAAYGLVVVMTHAARRTVILSGTAHEFCAAFQVQLHHFAHDGGTLTAARTGVRSKFHAGTRGASWWRFSVLDNRPQARPHMRLRAAPQGGAASAAEVSFNPPQVAALSTHFPRAQVRVNACQRR